jgi:hypothetical protein
MSRPKLIMKDMLLESGQGLSVAEASTFRTDGQRCYWIRVENLAIHATKKEMKKFIEMAQKVVGN